MTRTLLSICLLAAFTCAGVGAAPDTVASVRERAHREIALRDAEIAVLQAKVSADEKQLTVLRQQLTPMFSAPDPGFAAQSTPFQSSFTPGLSPLQQSTAEAVDAHAVSMTINMTDAFSRTAIVDLGVQNLSAKPISFTATPTMYYGIGLFSTMKTLRVSPSPFESPADQAMNIFAAASAGGRGVASGEMPLPGAPPTAQNTVISPGETLYVRISGPVYGSDHIPTKLTFKGGGWDFYTLNVHVSP